VSNPFGLGILKDKIYFAFELVLLEADPGLDCFFMRSAPVIDPRALFGKFGNFTSLLTTELRTLFTEEERLGIDFAGSMTVSNINLFYH
jgi:hypothetical protein